VIVHVFPLLESPKKPGYESVSSELTGEEIQLWVPRLTIWLFFVEKEIFAWQVPLETSCHDFLRGNAGERTFL